LVGGFYLFKWWASGVAGGGGSEQIAPDTVKAGESAKVDLKLSVWGGSGQIQNRYKNIFLNYQITDEDLLGQLSPKLISQDDKSQTYEFSIPTHNNSSGEITYSFEFKFDGQTNRIEGIKKIKVVGISTTTPGNNTLQTSDEVKLTGAIQSIVNQQPVDGNLRVKINNTWIIIGGGEMAEPNTGTVIGMDLNRDLQFYVGKKAEVYARKTGYDQSLTILGNSKYYLKIIQ
jgi:hypothetical protein